MYEDIRNAIEDLEFCLEGDTAPYHDTMTTSIGALRKQLPRKPYTTGKWIGYVCKDCGWRISPLDENNYCPSCGQRLDWEEL